MQERDPQCYHTGICSTFPWKHRKVFPSPVSNLVFCKNTLLLKNKKARTWETATVEDIADETYNGPGNVSKCAETAWLCGLNPVQTQCHSGKGTQNLFVVTFKCNLYNAGGRFLGTYFKKLLDMMSISTLLEPLNILSGNPASESLLLWRYTDLLEGEKKMEVKRIVRSGGFFVYQENTI